MDTTYKEHIQTCIKNKKALYESQPNEMVASFRREKSITNDYNGRQILELIQNADDQESDKILIELNESCNILRISNKGLPFSTQGYSSLFIDNLSPKTNRKQFIGNKGLGFRAILNWALQIKVISNDFALEYSEDIASQEFERLFDKETQLQLQNDYANSKDVILVPLLAFPEFRDEVAEDGYTTTIEIVYKDEVLPEIKKQIKELDENILLFLNNINEIRFKGILNDNVFSISKQISDPAEKDDLYADEKIIVNNTTWHIYKKEGILPQELLSDNIFEGAEFFEIRLAYTPQSTNKNHYLYSYFPTNILLDFPFLLHVTFDLTANRNNIVKSEKNKYIARECAKFIVSIALKMTKLSNESNWQAYEMVNMKNKIKDLEDNDFYQPLENAKKTEKIYPCIDNTYKLLGDTYILDKNLTELIEQTLNGKKLFSTVIKSTNHFINHTRKIPNFKELIETLELKDIKQRAQLIYLLYKDDKTKGYYLLLNKEESVINDIDEVYTPSNKQVSIPSFCKLEFIHNDLYEELISEFKINSEKKARELSSVLEAHYKLVDYEPSPLANKIIRDSRLPNNINNESINKEAVQSLFRIFQTNPNANLTTTVRLRTKSNALQDASKLIFPSSYPNNKKVEDIFKGVYSDEDYLSENNYYELDADDTRLTYFFTWLGVNKYAHYTENRIAKFQEILNGLDRELLVCWINFDPKLESYLRNNTGQVKDNINRKFYFQKYLIEDRYTWFNQNPFNYNHRIFREEGLSKKSIDSILIYLGAKEDINQLDVDQIQYILDQIPEQLPDGRGSQTLYKRLMRDNLQIKKDTLLFADDGVKLKTYKSSLIYFSEKVVLPNQLKSLFPIFNFSARSGGKNAVRFFQIRDLDNINIVIKDYTEADNKQEFNNFVKELAPYILASRLSNIKDDETKTRASKQMQEFEIIFCDEAHIETQAGILKLHDNEYILNKDDGRFYFKLSKNASLKTRSTQRISFQRALSEVFSLVLDVSADKAKFELDINYALDSFEYLKQRYKSEMSEDSIEEAKELLEIATPNINFIRIICQLLGKDYEKDCASIEELFEVDKIDFDNWYNLENLLFVYSKLCSNNVVIKDFNTFFEYQINFSNFHKETVKKIILDKAVKIRYSLWKSLENKTSDLQQQFLNEYNKWENYNSYTIIDKYKDVSKIDVKLIFNEIRNELYSDLELEENKEWEIANDIYKKNKDTFSDDDYQKIRENLEKESLLYFDNIGILQEWLNSERLKQKKPSVDISNKNNNDIDATSLVVSDSLFESTSPNPQSSYSGTAYRFSTQQSKNNIQKGLSAEKKALSYLKQHFEDVDHTSNFDDGQHYDMRYKCPDRNKWVYVEVKSFDQNNFYLSREEYKFGKENKEQYEIWLIRGDSLYIIKDFFDESNSNKYRLEIDNYIVYTKPN